MRKAWSKISLKRFSWTYKLLYSTINRTKGQPIEWKKIFANDTTNKGLIFKTYKQFIQFDARTQTILKRGKRPKKIFLQNDIQVANRHMRRCSALLIISKMPIKTTIKYHLMLGSMAII